MTRLKDLFAAVVEPLAAVGRAADGLVARWVPAAAVRGRLYGSAGALGLRVIAVGLVLYAAVLLARW